MGSQIALQTAMSGRYSVALIDSDAAQIERAQEQNRKLVARAVEKGRATAEAGEKALSAITAGTDFDRLAGGADLVIEAIYENLEAKLDVFRRMDAAAPAHAILASNSSTIAISRLAGATGRPERCCNMHFFHPVTVMQLCEVVRGPQTSEETVAAAMDFVRSINRVPVLIQKEIHGFIVNRVLFAAAEEALSLLEGGYASAEDIDIAVKKGLNWPMGPFELLDFSGIDVIYGALDDRHKLGQGKPPSPVLKKLVDEGRLGRKSGHGFFDY